MPVEVKVGPPVITINNGHAFLVAGFDGSIADASDQGLYFRDTRYLSRYQLFIDGKPWMLLNSGAIAYWASRTYFVNPTVPTDQGVMPSGTVGLILTRAISDAFHEDLEILNYTGNPLYFTFEMLIRSDFADIFEVKDRTSMRRGHIESQWDSTAQQLTSRYQHRDFRRALVMQVAQTTSPAAYGNGRLNFSIELKPNSVWRCCCHYEWVEDDSRPRTARHCATAFDASDTAKSLTRWKESTTQVTTSNEEWYRLYRQSVEDMAALRLPYDGADFGGFLPAAGVPWFVTVFGRDSLIVSLQNMTVYPGFALGTLKRLAELQASGTDDYRDAEPGKMPHELRSGELAHFRRIPHLPYYGTADATILYVITLHEAWKWLGDDGLFHSLKEVVKHCMEWIDRHGDLDGDGFQEYETRSSKGYENMGWKDAHDAVLYPDGSPVKGPKALCELQGYVFDAKQRLAEAADYFGESAWADQLRREAASLQAQFEEQFWCEDLGFYAYALDGDKRPVKTIASNAGHLLWSRIARPDRAERVVKRLMQPDMWSGWGIRTLSERHPAYNPFSYQNGSVWPHDNGIIAMGFKRYGFSKEAAMISRDISEAGSYFSFHRLPELYAGITRAKGSFPVQYLGANVPQAWAAGSVFYLLRAILGLDANAHQKQLIVDPVLPEWLPDITLRHLRVGEARIDLRFWREGDKTRYEVLSMNGQVRVTDARSH
jgi:glycogen debranching enzyme